MIGFATVEFIGSFINRISPLPDLWKKSECPTTHLSCETISHLYQHGLLQTGRERLECVEDRDEKTQRGDFQIQIPCHSLLVEAGIQPNPFSSCIDESLKKCPFPMGSHSNCPSHLDDLGNKSKANRPQITWNIIQNHLENTRALFM